MLTNMRSFITKVQCLNMLGKISEEINLLSNESALKMVYSGNRYRNEASKTNFQIPTSSFSNIESEEYVSIFYGPNGSGKSSLVKGLNSLIELCKWIYSINWESEERNQTHINLAKNLLWIHRGDPVIEDIPSRFYEVDFSEYQTQIEFIEHILNGFSFSGVSQIDSDIFSELPLTDTDTDFEVSIKKLNPSDYYREDQLELLERLELPYTSMYCVEFKPKGFDYYLELNFSEDPMDKPLMFEDLEYDERSEILESAHLSMPFLICKKSNVITALPPYKLNDVMERPPDPDSNHQSYTYNENYYYLEDYLSNNEHYFIDFYGNKPVIDYDEIFTHFHPLQSKNEFASDNVLIGSYDTGDIREQLVELFEDLRLRVVKHKDEIKSINNEINIISKSTKEKSNYQSTEVQFDSSLYKNIKLVLNPSNSAIEELFGNPKLRKIAEKDQEIEKVKFIKEINDANIGRNILSNRIWDSELTKLIEYFEPNNENYHRNLDLIRVAIYDMVVYIQEQKINDDWEEEITKLYNEYIVPSLIDFDGEKNIQNIPRKVPSYWSSGQKRMYSLMCALSDTTTKGPIVIDEPELSLHPNWQWCLKDMFVRICAITNRQLILITHSPHIVENFPDERLHMFDIGNTGL